MQILPNLVDVIPEARLNLVIYYLKQDDVREAFELIKDLEPAVPQEYILKGIVNAVMGQETNSVSYGDKIFLKLNKFKSIDELFSAR